MMPLLARVARSRLLHRLLLCMPVMVTMSMKVVVQLSAVLADLLYRGDVQGGRRGVSAFSRCLRQYRPHDSASLLLL